MDINIGFVEIIQPVQIALTFKTQKELDLFQKLMGHNNSVPDMIAAKYPFAKADDRDTLSEMMDNIHRGIVDFKNGRNKG